jgi:hypothetical protein
VLAHKANEDAVRVVISRDTRDHGYFTLKIGRGGRGPGSAGGRRGRVGCGCLLALLDLLVLGGLLGRPQALSGLRVLGLLGGPQALSGLRVPGGRLVPVGVLSLGCLPVFRCPVLLGRLLVLGRLPVLGCLPVFRCPVLLGRLPVLGCLPVFRCPVLLGGLQPLGRLLGRRVARQGRPGRCGGGPA